MQAMLQDIKPLTSAIQAAQEQDGPVLLDLGAIPGLPLMPTLNGLLLGYPVVYQLSDAQQAERASRALSSSVLLLHRVMLNCRMTSARGQAAGSATKQAAGTQGAGMLCAFSVPEELADSVQQRVGLWVESMRAAVARAEVWDVPEVVRVLVGPGPVAL
jgi:hypothetical protein